MTINDQNNVTYSLWDVTTEHMTLKNGIFCTVTMATGEGKTLALCRVRWALGTKQDAMNTEHCNVGICCWVQ